MIIDLHIHESTFSSDSKMSLEEIVADARRKGLDGVCITDHDSIGLRQYAERYAEESHFPIFVGVEYYSLEGDITAWGIDGIPDGRVSAQEFIDHVRVSDGFCVSCHPFRNNKRGLEDNLRKVRGLHGVEVLNGSTDPESNRKALDYCEELGLAPIGASDAHHSGQIGKYATWLPHWADNLSDFIKILKSGKCRPVILENGVYRFADRFRDFYENTQLSKEKAL